MKSFKRLLISLSAQAERIVNDFENHEAVADSAIQEFAKLVASVDEQLREVSARIEALDRRIGQLSSDEHAWAERALREHDSDKARALECVRRLHATRLALAQAQQHKQNAVAARAEIQQRSDEMRAQLESLLQRRYLLAARQHQADAQQLVATARLNPTQDLQQVLTRWETRITATEALQPRATTADNFAAAFQCAEEEESLRDTLMALVENAKQNGKIQ